MRADAARSRRRILDAARDVFPDREALVRDLTGDLLARLESVPKRTPRRSGTPSRPYAARPRRGGDRIRGCPGAGRPLGFADLVAAADRPATTDRGLAGG
ncbi:hypothetical protein [Embleya sp. MST-111070]|uniref:hypothetical protein n=1 Tax=Embleya sp. MST-111070 TaxID=3398231 RepID=UPI003F7339C8